MTGDYVPRPGEWPVDPQEDVDISDERIWVDGCFDFAHHGHAGAMLQARQLGNELLVGIHSDEAILENKGPTVMTLAERVAAVDACRWATRSIPHAPYVTMLPWISHYGCRYVVHGDDITSDSDGNDCYRFVKEAGRFKVVKRTPGISTTDLVGRMLLCTRNHFIWSLEAVLAGTEGDGTDEEKQKRGSDLMQRIKDYATDQTGLRPGCEVWSWRPPNSRPQTLAESQLAPERPRERSSLDSHSTGATGVLDEEQGAGSFKQMVRGKGPQKGQRIVYVDGGFDLFSSGHIEFLRNVTETERELGRQRGWYTDEAIEERLRIAGENYDPCYVVAGVHDDEVINRWKGINYPIMNLFERSLCVLQCKYVHALIFSAPFTPTTPYLHALPFAHAPDPDPAAMDATDTVSGLPAVVYHGPTAFMPLTYDPYTAAKNLGIFQEVQQHDYAHVNAGEIVDRILKNRVQFEERQRAKGVKAVGEKVAERREKEEQAERDRQTREGERMSGA